MNHSITQPFSFDFMAFLEPTYLILTFCIIYVLTFSFINFRKELLPLGLVAFFLMFMTISLLGASELSKQKKELQENNKEALFEASFVLISPFKNDTEQHAFYHEICKNNGEAQLVTNDVYHYSEDFEYKEGVEANIFCKGIL